jgi:hypothetical protein
MRSLEVEHLSWHSGCRCEQPGVSLDSDVERELSPSPAWRQAASSGGARRRAGAAAGQPELQRRHVRGRACVQGCRQAAAVRRAPGAGGCRSSCLHSPTCSSPALVPRQEERLGEGHRQLAGPPHLTSPPSGGEGPEHEPKLGSVIHRARLGALQPSRQRQPEITTLPRGAGGRGVPQCVRDCRQCHTAAG